MFNKLPSLIYIRAAKIPVRYGKEKHLTCFLKTFIFNLGRAIDIFFDFCLRIRAYVLWFGQVIRSRFTNNEFDLSFSIDLKITLYLSEKERERYQEDLIKRRRRAHLKDMRIKKRPAN